jgi:hypothetical protein
MIRKALFPLIIFAILLFQVSRAKAAVDWDPVTDAEKSMKANPIDPGAGAVVLFKRGKIDVLEQSSLFWTTRIQTYVRIKVFNDAGRDAGNISVDHEKRFRLSKIEGRTILPSGEIIPLDSSKVFQGVAYKSGNNFAILETSFTFPSVAPGAIIEYELEETVDSLFPPSWIFDTLGIGTMNSSLQVTVGPRLGMAQFPLDNVYAKISVAESTNVKGYQINYNVKNLRPIQDEPYAPPFRDQATMVLFTPTELGFGGDVYPLIRRWDDIADEIKRELGNMEKSEKDARGKAKELADKVSDPRKKAQAIYSYLQQNVKSSNLAGVGLGRTADEILSSKRGDPDEINALYILMLHEAKVDADMVLVATQNWWSLVKVFPNYNQFSRIVTRLNFKDGTGFADPADAAAPFGELPWFDRGVLGLAIKGNKIQDALLPSGTVDENASTATSTIQVGKDWSLEGDEETDMKGAEAIDFRSMLVNEEPEKLERTLTDIFAYGRSDAEVSKIEHPEFRDSSQPIVLKAHVKERATNELERGGLLLNPWMGDTFERPMFTASVRHSAVRFNFAEKRTSTSIWKLAPEIKVEQLPKDVKIENDLGAFSHSCAQSGTTVTCTRAYTLKNTLLKTNIEYLNAKKFFEEIAKQDQEVMVLRSE